MLISHSTRTCLPLMYPMSTLSAAMCVLFGKPGLFAVVMFSLSLELDFPMCASSHKNTQKMRINTCDGECKQSVCVRFGLRVLNNPIYSCTSTAAAA